MEERLDERRGDLDRCDSEISRIADYNQPFAWLNSIGHADWEAEKHLIMKENLEEQLQQFVRDATRTEPDGIGYGAALERLSDPRTIRLLHAAMGLCTEAGEFMDQLKRHVFYGKPLDEINLKEELGDSSWYERVAIDALETSYLGMLQTNVDKLKRRFPDKFTEERAGNRDLEAERKILEGA